MLLLNLLGSRFDSDKDTVDDRAKMPTREFSVDVTAINVRTEDSLRADIEATVYVYISRDEKSIEKAINFFGEGNEIDPQSISNAVTKRTESAIRVAVGEKNLEDLHKKRQDLSQEVESSLTSSLNTLGLTVNDIVIGNIEENENYSANNYFDAKILEERTEIIQHAIRQNRIQELETQQAIREKELETQQAIREKELETQQAIREKELETEKKIRTDELNTEKDIRNQELTTGRLIENEEIEFEEHSLDNNQKIETAKLNQEKAIEVLRLQVEADIQVAEEQENSKVEQEKIKQDLAIAQENKQLQLLQAQVQGTVEMQELQVLITILRKEQEKLTAEIERAKTEEAVKTAIQEEKADCRHKIAQKAAQAAKEEANAIKALTEAEGERYKLIPPNDVARIAQMIQELAPQLMEKLPELAEALEALAPKAGVLGDSNVYTFPGSNGEGLNQLMLSTSGMLLIKTLMEGKFGQILEQAVKSVKDDKNVHSS